MRVKEESEKAGLKLNVQKTKIMASGPITAWQIEGRKVETATDFLFLDSKITADGDCNHGIKRCLLLGKKAMINLDSILKNRDITLLTKVRMVKAMVFPVVLYRSENWTTKKGWALKNGCFRTVMLGKTLECPMNCKEIKSVNTKGNHPWMFIGRTAAEAEAPILWLPDTKSWLIRKDPDAGKDWRQEEKRAAEDEMVRQHRLLSGHEFEQTPGGSGGQRSLACCSP